MFANTLLQQAWTASAAAGRGGHLWLSLGPLRTQCSTAIICNDEVSTSSSGGSSSNGGSQSYSSSKITSRATKQLQQYRKRLAAYKARLPKNRKYGVELRERQPSAYEQMRLVVGYYDLPQTRNMPRPPPVSHAMINNMQTLLHTKAVDPYYKLSLLSYRSKLQNDKIVQSLSKVQLFLWELAAPPELVPVHLAEIHQRSKP